MPPTHDNTQTTTSNPRKNNLLSVLHADWGFTNTEKVGGSRSLETKIEVGISCNVLPSHPTVLSTHIQVDENHTKKLKMSPVKEKFDNQQNHEKLNRSIPIITAVRDQSNHQPYKIPKLSSLKEKFSHQPQIPDILGQKFKIEESVKSPQTENASLSTIITPRLSTVLSPVKTQHVRGKGCGDSVVETGHKCVGNISMINFCLQGMFRSILPVREVLQNTMIMKNTIPVVQIDVEKLLQRDREKITLSASRMQDQIDAIKQVKKLGLVSWGGETEVRWIKLIKEEQKEDNYDDSVGWRSEWLGVCSRTRSSFGRIYGDKEFGVDKDSSDVNISDFESGDENEEIKKDILLQEVPCGSFDNDGSDSLIKDGKGRGKGRGRKQGGRCGKAGVKKTSSKSPGVDFYYDYDPVVKTAADNNVEGVPSMPDRFTYLEGTGVDSATVAGTEMRTGIVPELTGTCPMCGDLMLLGKLMMDHAPYCQGP